MAPNGFGLHLSYVGGFRFSISMSPERQLIAERWKDKVVNMPVSNAVVERCIEDCLQCLRWCSECRDESLAQDPTMMKESIRLCGECSELCRTCVPLLTGRSQFADRVCGVCSELCLACATECARHEGETMRKCALACRRCATTCAEVAQGGPIRVAAAQA